MGTVGPSKVLAEASPVSNQKLRPRSRGSEAEPEAAFEEPSATDATGNNRALAIIHGANRNQRK